MTVSLDWSSLYTWEMSFLSYFGICKQLFFFKHNLTQMTIISTTVGKNSLEEME